MREGQDCANASLPIARAAEDLVRASGGPALLWEDCTVNSHFQPIYCVRRQSCFGFEALARAVDASGNAVACHDFFGRHSGERRALLDWACRVMHLRNYATVDPGDRTLFLNVHPESAVRDLRCGPELVKLIRYYGLVPKRVCLEILEHPCSDEEALRDAVERYRSFGIAIAIDDFGVSASNLDRVKLLRPDLVKIDRSVTHLLPTIVGLLHELDVRVAVEGVETPEAAAATVDAGADYIQGYYFAQPAPALANESRGRELLDRLIYSPRFAYAA
jgi:EAL domain-containing protein (putative c-di-GMP-specific phosphodiesterase class I)